MSFSQTRDWSYSLPVALLLMAPFDILASLAMDVYLPVISIMPNILATTPEIVQLTLSLYMIILGMGQLIFGPLSDQFGRRPVVLWGSLIFGCSSLLLSATSEGLTFVGLRVIQGAGASAMLVATFSTVRDVYGKRPEGAVIYSLFSSMLAFVPALGPIAGALIADYFGWRTIFISLGIMSLAANFHAFVRWHETKPQTLIKTHLAFKEVLSDKKFWTYTIGFSTAMGTFFVFFSTAPRVLMDRNNFTQLTFSFVFASVAVVMIITSRFVGRFLKTWRVEGCFTRGLSLITFGAVVLGFLQMIFGLNGWIFIGSMYIMAIGIVMTVSVTANGALEKFSHIAGSATALYYSLQSLIVGIVGTVFTIVLIGDTAWPLIGFAICMSCISLGLKARVR